MSSSTAHGNAFVSLFVIWKQSRSFANIHVSRSLLLSFSLGKFKTLFQQFDHAHTLADGVPFEFSLKFSCNLEIEGRRVHRSRRRFFFALAWRWRLCSVHDVGRSLPKQVTATIFSRLLEYKRIASFLAMRKARFLTATIVPL